MSNETKTGTDPNVNSNEKIKRRMMPFQFTHDGLEPQVNQPSDEPKVSIDELL